MAEKTQQTAPFQPTVTAKDPVTGEVTQKVASSPLTENPVPKGDSVVMIFPKDVILTLPTGERHKYTKGIHKVPAMLSNGFDGSGNPVLIPAAEHWWLKANKVEVFDPAKSGWNPRKQEREINEKTVKFLQYSGFDVKTTDDAKGFVDRLPDDASKDAFFSDCEKWSEEPSALPEFTDHEYRYLISEGYPASLTKDQAADLVAKFDRKHADEFFAAAKAWEDPGDDAEDSGKGNGKKNGKGSTKNSQ